MTSGDAESQATVLRWGMTVASREMGPSGHVDDGRDTTSSNEAFGKPDRACCRSFYVELRKAEQVFSDAEPLARIVGHRQLERRVREYMEDGEE